MICGSGAKGMTSPGSDNSGGGGGEYAYCTYAHLTMYPESYTYALWYISTSPEVH